MHKLPTPQERKQIELQKLSVIANTQFQLSSTFLNTLLARQDVDLADENSKEVLVDMAFDYANALMLKLGMVIKADKVE